MALFQKAFGGPDLFAVGYKDYYKNKSVLPSWKFMVEFVPNERQTDDYVNSYLKRVKYHHVVDVSLPVYEFELETTKYGPIAKTFPKINHNGFTIKITMEDDSDGNILALIHALQRTVVTQDGVYKRLPENKVGNIIIHLYNHAGTEVCHWIANSIFYLGAQEINLNYTSDDTLKYGLTFGCDTIRFRKNLSTID